MVMLGMRMRKMVEFNVTVYAFHLSIHFAHKKNYDQRPDFRKSFKQ